MGCREDIIPYCRQTQREEPSPELSSLWSRDQKEVEGRVWCQLWESSSSCAPGPC